MRPLALFVLLALPLLGASESAPPTPDQMLAAARADVARAGAEEQRLTAAASRAAGEAQRLAGEQRAAAAAIDGAEARIAAAEAELTIARAAVAAGQARLAERQAPVAGLLAGLISMGRQPPLLALAAGSSEEFVRVRALLDVTMPAIRARTAALSSELAGGQRAAQAAEAARDNLATERAGLDRQRARFASLEKQALERQQMLAGQAVGAGDANLAGGETLATLDEERARQRAGQATAHQLASLAPLPARPSPDDARPVLPPFAYQLIVDAPLAAGLGSVDADGIRSRGLAFANARGAALTVPADGTIAFAGPYRRSDGIVIIDHGGGWLSLIVNAGTTLAKGARVRRGDPLGRALGPLQVELSRGGTNVSPAFIAASSTMLSNPSKGG
ncbi:MAG: peptidoglycan DD-metalloendopeptidase family protein [Sphingomicrobium sp.]